MHVEGRVYCTIGNNCQPTRDKGGMLHVPPINFKFLDVSTDGDSASLQILNTKLFKAYPGAGVFNPIVTLSIKDGS